MVIYTTDGLRQLSIMFNRYEKSPDSMSLPELAQARDFAKAQEHRYIDLAWMIADRLGNRPTWYRMTTEGIYRRCRSAYQKWISGNAELPDMVDAQNYCVYQSDLWADEVELINDVIEERIKDP